MNPRLAGTNPTDNTSFFRITHFATGVTNWVTLNSSSNRLYRLMISKSLSGPWTEGPSSPGTGGTMTVTDTNRPQTIYYRVKAFQP